MSKRKELRSVNAQSIGLSNLKDALIVDHLTPKAQQLFAEAKHFRDSYGWRFCWTKNGQVFLRKTEYSRQIKVKDSSDIQRFSEIAEHIQVNNPDSEEQT